MLQAEALPKARLAGPKLAPLTSERMHISTGLSLAPLLMLSLACSAAPTKTGPQDSGAVLRIPVSIATESGTETFQAEVADSPQKRQVGLMFRKQLEEREGMLFLFPAEQQLSFWMKNTLISLDMVFIRTDKTILGVVHRAEPRTLTSRKVPGRSQFVLELAGGTAEKLGIKSGQKVVFMAPAPSR